MRKLLLLAIAVVFAAIGVLAQIRTQTTIQTALAKRADYSAAVDRAYSYGLICTTVLDRCDGMIARAEKNPKLKAALLRAKNAGVTVFPGPLNWPGVSDFGGVYINTFASDERIIAFLTN